MSITLPNKIQRKCQLTLYLNELEVLLGRVVKSEELGSVDEAEEVRRKSIKLSSGPISSCNIPFSDKNNDRFKQFLNKLISANSSPVFIWTPRTINCGILTIPDLSEIKMDFSFGINQEGILVFLTSDICDRLLLDFGVGETNEERLTIELQGNNWREIAY